MRLEQFIQETKGLATQHDEGIYAAWLSLAEQRLDELETGKVQGVSWEEIKSQLKRPL
ncbi:MAG: addiction module protein [Gammaproteobacteria bacterium]|nr:addiction module protein [Gammaproteobacteria bacterium]